MPSKFPTSPQQFDLPKGVDLDLPPDAALDSAEQPADAPQPPKQRPRRARVPERAAIQADKYFHIPKDPTGEVTFDELAYELSRVKAGLSVITRSPENDSDDDEATTNVA